MVALEQRRGVQTQTLCFRSGQQMVARKKCTGARIKPQQGHTLALHVTIERTPLQLRVHYYRQEILRLSHTGYTDAKTQRENETDT